MDTEPTAAAAAPEPDDAEATAPSSAEPAAVDATVSTDGGDISDGYGVVKALPGKASTKVVNAQMTSDDLYATPAEAPASATTKVRVLASYLCRLQ